MARSRIRVRVDGLEGLRRHMAELPDEIRDAIRRTIREESAEVRDGTRRRVRTKSGALWRGVRVVPTEDGLAARVGWVDPELYYAKFHEYGTKRFPAQPALGPAIEEERPKLRARLVDNIREALREMER